MQWSGPAKVHILSHVTDGPSSAAYQPFAPFSEWQYFGQQAVWLEFKKALNFASESASPEDLDAALEVAVRSAALETGAIEGLYATSRGVTRTVALQGAMWELELDKLGSDVRGHFEAQFAAFDLVLDAATRRLPITEAWLRALQAEVCGAQATYETLTDAGKQQQRLPHGEYKTSRNNVTQQDGTIHWYASVHDVPAEMHRLVTEMGSNAFQDAHAAVQAAFAHHALTAVHPFADGNGRTARALASVFLYRSAGVPPACREPHVRMQ